jgi:hypothetical protein
MCPRMAHGHEMSEDIEGLARRLVVGHKRDGRSIYDPQAKAELIEIGRRGDLSMARLACECGVTAGSRVRLSGSRTALYAGHGPLASETSDTSPDISPYPVEARTALPPLCPLSRC